MSENKLENKIEVPNISESSELFKMYVVEYFGQIKYSCLHEYSLEANKNYFLDEFYSLIRREFLFGFVMYICGREKVKFLDFIDLLIKYNHSENIHAMTCGKLTIPESYIKELITR